MRGPLETDLIVYGRLPLMIFENCAIRRQHGGKCSCQNGVTYLTDRRRERFPLLNEFGCRNTLLNSRPLCLREDFFPSGHTDRASAVHHRIARGMCADCPRVPVRRTAGRRIYQRII